MSEGKRRFWALFSQLGVHPIDAVLDQEVELRKLGFDSMAMITLLIELESQLNVPLEALQACLHQGCTIARLIALCERVATAPVECDALLEAQAA
jgi:acyl carrier protein